MLNGCATSHWKLKAEKAKYIKYLRIWPTVCGKAYLLEVDSIYHYHLYPFTVQLRVSSLWAMAPLLALFWQSLSSSSSSYIVPSSVAAAAMSGFCGGLLPGRGGEMSDSFQKTLTMIKLFWCSRVTSQKYILHLILVINTCYSKDMISRAYDTVYMLVCVQTCMLP